MAILLVLVVGLLCVLVFAINFRVNARSTGQALASAPGTAAGWIAGSFEGLTEGRAAGKEAGLSAEDTTVSIDFHSDEKLQVLVTSGMLSDILRIGEEGDEDYAALLSMRYTAVFTVDLASLEKSVTEDGLRVLLDAPSVEFKPVGDIEIGAVYQKGRFTGAAEDGYLAFLNSNNKIKKEAAASLLANSSMMAAAKSSAEAQISRLMSSASRDGYKVTVEFRGEESDK